MAISKIALIDASKFITNENGNIMSFSVLIPVYYKDNPIHFDLALQTIWDDQTIKPNEIVIVKDGPLSLELENVITHFSRRAPTKLVALKTNMGLGHALKDGVLACSNEYIARMDSDDIALPDRFAKQMEFFRENPDICLCGGMIEEFSGEPLNVTGFRILPLRQHDIVKFAKLRNPFNHMTVAFRKSAIVQAGNYEHLPGYEDYWLWARVIAGGGRAGNLPDVLVRARAGENMLKRRRGWKFFLAEIDLAKKLKGIGLLSWSEMIRNIFLKGCIRLMPVYLLKKIYIRLRKDVY